MENSKSIYGKLNTESHWYAFKTQHRHEKKVIERLQQKDINCYLPLFTTYREWSDRRKKVSEPLFSCYIFAKLPLKERLGVLQTDGVINLVSFRNIPAPIPEIQIESIKQVLCEIETIQRIEYFTTGQKVEVIFGPLKGIIGTMLRVKDKARLVISIDAIHQSFAVEIDASWVKSLE